MRIYSPSFRTNPILGLCVVYVVAATWAVQEALSHVLLLVSPSQIPVGDILGLCTHYFDDYRLPLYSREPFLYPEGVVGAYGAL